MRLHARAVERDRLKPSDMDIPPFPVELLDHLRMRVKDLTPNEYWETSRNDYELATEVQNAWRLGVQDAQSMHQAKQ